MNSQSFLLSWIKITIYGWLLGFVFIVLLAFGGEALGLGEFQFFIGIAIGAGVGYMQGRFLKIYFDIDWKWVVVSSASMGLSFAFFDLARTFSTIEYNLFYSVALGGLLVSVAQYYILRLFFKNSLLWIPVSWLAWMAAGGLVRLTELIDILGLPGLVSAIIVLVILTIGASALLGLITGLGLKRIIVVQS